MHTFFRAQGVQAIVSSDGRSDGGTVFGESAGWHEAKWPSPLPVIALTPEHYNRIARLLEKKTSVTLSLQVAATISAADVQPSNIVAELPGGAKADEIVLVGGHLDSWIGGTGATDNAAGCTVAIEAMRILKSLNLKLDRTVRLVLWSGEEQGLQGSKAYVKEHFGDPTTMQVKPGHEKVSAYFNLDNGGGKMPHATRTAPPPAMVDSIFRALSDPTRRDVIERLSARQASVSELAAPYEMALPSFLQHLKRARRMRARALAQSRARPHLPARAEAAEAGRRLARTTAHALGPPASTSSTATSWN